MKYIALAVMALGLVMFSALWWPWPWRELVSLQIWFAFIGAPIALLGLAWLLVLIFWGLP